MVTIPFLGWMTWRFISLSEEEVQKNFSWSCYLFLLAIFVAMTNQVRHELVILYEVKMFISFSYKMSNCQLANV
jgi:hypothetical protein